MPKSKNQKITVKKDSIKGESKSTKTLKTLRAAVIGIGSMGRHHVRNYAQIPNTDLVGVADLDEIAGQKLALKFETQFYSDYRRLLEIERPDIVSLAVPTKLHHELAMDIIGRNIHVLIEKPISYTVDEAKEIIEEAKKVGVKVTVGHIERFNPAVVKLKELIADGKLGTIVSIMARRAGTIPARIKDANVIVDIGVHDIDLLNFILETKPQNIFASGGRAILKKHEDYADIFLEYPNSQDGLKITGHIQVNWLTPVKIRKLNITGTRGYAVVNLATQELILFDTQYSQDFDDFDDFIGKFKESKGKKIAVDLKEPLRLQLESFITSVLTGKEVAVTAEDALQALRAAILSTETIRIKDGKL